MSVAIASVVNAIARIFEAYDEGCPALLVTGRSLYDLVLDPEGRIRPLVEALRRDARRERGMHVVTYSMAAGLDWDVGRVGEARDRDAIERALRSHRLLDIPQDQNEVVRVLRGISSLARAQDALRWSDGRPLRFLFLCEFGEHLAPGTLTNGTQTDAQLVAIELAHVTAQSLALRTSGHMVVFHAREGLVDPRVCGAMRHLRLRQPDSGEKGPFVTAALALYDEARMEPPLTPDVVARLSANTPNRSIEQLLRAAHRRHRAITVQDVAAKKSDDIERLSEGTLTMLDSSRIEGLDLQGRNIGAPAHASENRRRASTRRSPCTGQRALGWRARNGQDRFGDPNRRRSRGGGIPDALTQERVRRRASYREVGGITRAVRDGNSASVVRVPNVVLSEGSHAVSAMETSTKTYIMPLWSFPSLR